MKPRTFCIIGAGNGAIALAGHLAFKGFPVHLYNRSREHIKNLEKTKTITLTGAVEGTGKLRRVTDDIGYAMDGAHVIMVVIPATGHIDVARKMAPFLKENQRVILNPGRTAGALEVYEYFRQNTKLKNPVVAEAQTLIYACRAASDTEAHIFQVKDQVTVAALPADRTKEALEGLNEAFPGVFTPARCVWETGLNNYGAIFHPGPTLLNMGRIENGDIFKYYTEGITPSVSRVLHRLDEERMAIARTLEVEAVSTLTWLKDSYGAMGETIGDCVKEVFAYRGILNPDSLDVRYITEDIPCSLVPMESVAKELSLSTPVMTALIDLANTVLGRDFRKEGRTVEKLGLGGMGAEEMKRYVCNGERGPRK